MKKAKKILALILAGVLIAGILTACNSPQETASNSAAPDNAAADNSAPASSSAKLPGGKDIYNDPIRISMISISTAGVANRLYQLALNDQASRYPNITIEYKDAEYDPSRQITLIQEAVTQGFDAVLIEAMDPVALNEAIESAERAGIPVISTNAAQPTATHTLHVRVEDFNYGWKSAEIMAGMANNEGTAIILDAPAVQKPSARMADGFEAYINENTNIRILEQIPIDNWSADSAQIAMRDCLTKYGPGELTMIYCANDDIAQGAMNAIDQAGRTGEFLIWGMFGYPAGLEGVRDGRMTGTMLSNVYVQFSMIFYMALQYISTGLTSVTAGYEKTMYIEMPLFPVTAENVDSAMIYSRWFD